MSEPVAVCPSCRAPLAKPPKRKARCPHCREDIYVRTKQELFPSHLLAESEMRAADMFSHLRSNYGVRVEDFRRLQLELSQRWGESASATDTVVSLLDDLMQRYPGQLKALNRDMAAFAASNGRDPRPWLRESRRAELEVEYQASPVVKGVRVLASYACCEECKAQNGDEYTVEEALEKMPLPYAHCTRTIGGQPGFCICTYRTIFKRPSEW